MSSRAQRCLNGLTLGYLKGTAVRDHPMVSSLALCPDNAKQDPAAYGVEFGVVFVAKGSRAAHIQEGPDCLDPYDSDLEGERHFWLVVSSRRYRLMRIEHARVRLAICLVLRTNVLLYVPGTRVRYKFGTVRVRCVYAQGTQWSNIIICRFYTSSLV